MIMRERSISTVAARLGGKERSLRSAFDLHELIAEALCPSGRGGGNPER
jgi:hypothetical protein